MSGITFPPGSLTNANSLGRYLRAPEAKPPEANRSGAAGSTGVEGQSSPRHLQRLDRRDADRNVIQQQEQGGLTDAVVADISELAKAFLQKFEESGASSGSFDLHLDLSSLGVSVSSQGTRSIDGRSLSIDLHVDASQGTFKTENGNVDFQSLNISFKIEETSVSVTDSASGGQLQAGGSTTQSPTRNVNIPPSDAPPFSTPPARSVMDNLKTLVSLLSEVAQGQSDDSGNLGMNILSKLSGADEARLNDLLKTLGQSLEALASQKNDGKTAAQGTGGVPGGRNIQFEMTRETTEVSIQSLQFTLPAARTQAPAPIAPPAPTTATNAPAAAITSTP